jgi:hypothetical protein
VKFRKEIVAARRRFGKYLFVERSHFSTGYALRFTVGVQTFTVMAGVTKAEANWFKAMMCLALSNVAEESRKKEKR